MGEFLAKLFQSDFMPHGHCYYWKPEIVWLHAASDGLIALSYYVIPVMLVYLVRKRRDLPFHWMFFMFGIFILGCGTTHAMEIWTLWHATYRLAGVIKAVTAAASLATAVALIPMVPRALLLPSPAQLRAANLGLENEIAERRRVEEALEAQRSFISAVLNTVDTLIVVMDLEGRIVQCNRACAELAGRASEQLAGRRAEELFGNGEGWQSGGFESHWTAAKGGLRLISWSTTRLCDAAGKPRHLIAAGVDITEAKRLERAVLEISAREQRRIGQDLHDGLGQQLTGIAFIAKALEQKLVAGSQPEAVDAKKIVQLVNGAIGQTRDLSRGLLPVEPEAEGLMSALEKWAGEVENTFGILCHFHCEEAIPIANEDTATQVFWIAQEAVNNALKHAKATQIDIRLSRSADEVMMQVEDDGEGLPADFDGGVGTGLGFRIMSYRASMVGGRLQVERGSKYGTKVTCRWPS